MASILIVDDAKFMRVTLRKLLENGGHTVIGKASDGQEAIERFDELAPTLVTLDINMPYMDGMEALKTIKNKDQKVVVEAIELGAKDFIVKPFDENRVLETMNHVIGN